jgi:drug/metabolite transporter (DMT)-like permease
MAVNARPSTGADALHHDDRAKPTGAYVAIAGIAIFFIATFLDWVSTTGEQATSASGYEADTVLAFTAFLGVGLAAALVYALQRARRNQHRGLTLTTMAVGIAAVLLSLGYVFDPPGAFERGADLDTELGAWIGLVGGILWAVGAGLFAKEVEGDDHRDLDRGQTVHADR